MKWLRRIILALPGVVLVVFLGGFCFVMYVPSEIEGRKHDPDEVLIKEFESHADQYQKLIAMFRDDRPASVIHPTWMSPKNVITAERWSEYKKLFYELQLDAGMRSWGGDSIWFIATAQGLVTGGSSKGYMYKPENPSPMYSSLDRIPDDLQSNVKGYRKINEEWYIVLDWDD